MLSRDVCRWCVQSISDEQWREVHPALTNQWWDRDRIFWKKGTVRCFYAHTDADVKADPPTQCPFKKEHAAEQGEGQQVLPIGNVADPRTKPAYIKITPVLEASREVLVPKFELAEENTIPLRVAKNRGLPTIG